MSAKLALISNDDYETVEARIPQLLTEPTCNSGKVLLILEDDKIMSSLIKQYASKFYSKILEFDSVEKAEFFLQNTNVIIDTALVDYFLPGKDGPEILSKIKKNANTQVVLMSGQSQDISTTKVLKEFDQFLPKPFTIKTLHDLFDSNTKK